MLKRRAIGLANTLFEMRNPESLVMIGLGQDRQAQMQESQRNLLLAIESDPGSDQARYALLKPRLTRIARGEEQPQRIRDALDQIRGTAAITVSAWLAATSNDWEHVTGLDAGLAAVQPTDLWYLDAVKLRVDWRIKDQSPGAQPERAREARRLIDDAIALFQDPDFYAMRLAASFVADDTPEIIETARRLVYIFNYEADLSESGELEPDIREVQNKLRQVEAVRVVLANLRDDERVPQYKLDLLEASIDRLSDRFVAIGAVS